MQQGVDPGMGQNFVGNFMNEPTAQMGYQFGKTVMAGGAQYMEQNVSCRSR